MRVAESVVIEIDRNAGPGAAIDGRVRTAAALAKTAIIGTSSCLIDSDDNYDSRTFDEIHFKLKGLPRRSDEPPHPLAHLGEAASIALCAARKSQGETIIFLVNDGGASLVASHYGIPARHFGQVMAELICGGKFTSGDAFDIFAMANSVSGVPQDVAPLDAEALECQKSGESQVCTMCDSIAPMTAAGVEQG
ncbi:hypothetical protein [Micromonospora lupini]|uniref:hypothetical protein n=1 Tax=Micromonospora lupini TaxID=285679 RepID=UPI0031D258E0